MLYKTLFALGAVILPPIIGYVIKHLYKWKTKNEIRLLTKCSFDESYYHCMFWTINNFECKYHLYNNIECGTNCSTVYLQTILRLLSSAKISISMCMYHLTLKQVAKELIKAKKKNVTVRIITDNISSKMEHSKLKYLQNRYGFDVRTPPYEDSFMHHKYCVIDSEDPRLQKIFLGSMNLTLQGCAGNFEFVVITNNSQIITCYNNEFNSLWQNFENSVPI